jgi:hypothetical protein
MRILSFSTWRHGAIGLFGLGAAGLWAISCGVATDDLFNSGEAQSAATGSSGGTGGATSSGQSSGRGSGSGGASGSGQSGSGVSASSASGAGGNADACGGCPSGLVCDPKLGCVECVSKAGCSDDAARFCVNGLCVACAANADCPDTQSCQPATHTCADKCANNGNACSDPTPLCDATKNVCVQCKDNAQCPGPEHLCNKQQGLCVECLTNANCEAPTSVCDAARGKCVECVINAQCRDEQVCSSGVCTPRCDEKSGCDSGLCDIPTGKCITCLGDDACRDGGQPHCSPLQGCVECVLSSDCSPGAVCIQFACVGG